MRCCSIVLIFVLSVCIFGCSGRNGDSAGNLPTIGEISQWGIAWTFSAPVSYGQFANGDYWVLGPVTITSISPAFDGSHHGFEANPNDVVAQGFDTRVANFDATRVPNLPYVAQPGQSLVKAISIEPLDDTDCRPCLQTASVLTVLAEAPPDAGATVFRPPYFGTAKPLYSTNDLRTSILPSLASTANTPSLADMLERFRRVHLDHKQSWTGAGLHPADNMAEYGSSISAENAQGALRLMLNDSLENKRSLLIAYVQNGIDLYHMLKGGRKWTAGGGHGEGRKLPIAFAAALLGNQEMTNAVRNAGTDTFGENGGMYYSQKAGTVLWGQGDYIEENYWRNLVFDTGSRTLSDPYRWIDGGHRPGWSYQYCCTTIPYKANAAAAYLMPEIKAMWNYEPFFQYVQRWVSSGTWSQPDPCAPPDGVCSGGNNAGASCTLANEASVCTGDGSPFCDGSANWSAHYGVTYGPNGAGDCILDNDPSDGIGRFPLLHGTNADEGYYGSRFAEEMWDAYVTP
jgi:hypothetical protein